MDYYDYLNYYSTPTQSSPLSGVFSLVVSILMIIAMWKIFEKAGEKGWKALIPIYDSYILWKIAGRNWIKDMLIIAGTFIAYMVFAFLNIQNSIFGIVSLLFGFVFVVYLLVAVCGYCSGLSHNFGHAGGFAVGLFFLHPIFLMILGFNSDKYVGEMGKSKQVEQPQEPQAPQEPQ